MSIRARLLLLILFATLIPALVAGMQFLDRRDVEIAAARQDIAAAARQVAQELQGTVRATAQLHYGLSHAPELDTQNRAACSAFLADVLNEYPQYTGLLTVKPNGELFCDSLRSGRTLNLTDRGYFQDAQDARKPLAVEPVFGRLTGRAVLQIAYAARRDTGEMKFMLLASLDLEKFMRSHSLTLPRQNAVIALVDGKGTVLTWHPDGEKLRGASIAGSPLFRLALADQGEQAQEDIESGGISRIWAASTLPEFPSLGLHVLVGVSKHDLLAAANRNLTQALAILLVVWLLVFAGTWILARGVMDRELAEGLRIRELNEQLERRVLERTAGLESVNQALNREIAERKQSEEALRASESRYRRLFETAQDGILILDAETGTIANLNPFLIKMLGYSDEAFLGRKIWEQRFFKDIVADQAEFTALQQNDHLRCENKSLETGDGRRIDVDFVSNVYLVNDHRVIQCNIRDVTERKRAEAELRIAAIAFESQEGMLITDADGTILRVNRAFTATTGYTAEETVGRTPRMLKSGRHDAAFYAAMWEDLTSAGTWQGEIWDRRKNGEVYPSWLTISAVRGQNGEVTHFVATHLDISQRKAAEDQLHKLAFYDPLTKLPNRRLLLDRLAHALAGSVRSRQQGAIMIIDLDNFKALNDTQGHDMGDRLLAEVTKRLQSSVRQGDTVARLGGDEFVVMLEDLEADGLVAAQVEGVAEKILVALDHTYRFDLGTGSGTPETIEYHCTASIGVTLFGATRENGDELLKQADLAMYQAKSAGRNTIRFFDPEMQASVTARVALEADLREAVHSGQFLLHYQPQLSGDDHRPTGAEALVRWQHPLRGLVSPAEFIPLAEESGLILPLGHWVLATACAQLAAWSTRAEMAHLSIAVNVSAQQFRQADFVDQVLAALADTGADPHRLKLELTESLLVDNVEEIIAKMSALKARGVGFSLDDFGTGYSSLSYLKRLPLDQLKIDQSFVRDVLTDPNDAAIAKMIVALADSLGLAVIAEGVETEEQRSFLAASGCLAYQGYLFSKPLPLAAFEQFAQRA